jgi:hypothetical protein
MDRSEEKYRQQLERSRSWKSKNPERHAELAKAYRLRNPQKTKAQNQLNYALRKGVVFRGPCEVCGSEEKVHAHHHDYSKPLDVHWLCFICHKKAHPVSEEDKKVKFSDAKRADVIGSNNPFSKLDEVAVHEIKLMLSCGVSQERIAKAFAVTQTTVSKIKCGEIWSHVK